MSEKAKEILFNCFGYIIVFITCLIYILTTIFVITPTGKNIGQIIGDGILAFLVGMAISYLLRVQGIINAMKDELVIKTMGIYATTIENVSGYVNKLDGWCHTKNELTYKQERTKLLARCGLKYDDCFTEEGRAKPFNYDKTILPIVKDKSKMKDAISRESERIRIANLKQINKETEDDYKFKKKCYWGAVNLKLTELYSTDLTSESGKKNDPHNMGLQIKEYVSFTSAKDIVIRALIAIIFGVYGIVLIQSFSWIYLIWNCFQVCIFLMFGFLGMRMAYMFITNEYRGRIIKKINYLEEFAVEIKSNEKKEGETCNDI